MHGKPGTWPEVQKYSTCVSSFPSVMAAAVPGCCRSTKPTVWDCSTSAQCPPRSFGSVFILVTTSSARLPGPWLSPALAPSYRCVWRNVVQFLAGPLHSLTIPPRPLAGSSVTSRVPFMIICLSKQSHSLCRPLSPLKEWSFFHIPYPSGPGSGFGFCFKIYCYQEIIPMLVRELLNKREKPNKTQVDRFFLFSL